MGDQNFMGGLLGGLAHGLKEQQDVNLKQSLAQAQMELIKAQAKHEEQKVKTALTLDQFRSQYFGQGQTGGQGQPAQPGGQGGGYPYVGLNDPWTKEAAAAKLFLDVNLPAPNMRPSVTRLPDGTILTTLNGKVVSALPGPVEAEKVMGTGPGGVPTAYHVPKQFNYPSGQSVTPGSGGLGAQPPQLGGGVPVGVPPMTWGESTDATGATTKFAMPVHPLPGQQFPATPGPAMTVTGPSSDQKTTLNNLDTTLQTINDLKNQAATIGGKGFGYEASMKHEAYQDPHSLKSWAARNLFESVGRPIDPKVTQFRASVEEFLSDFRHEKYGGQLTPNEIARFNRQATEATTPEQFNAALNAIENKMRTKRDVLAKSLVQTPAQKVQATPQKIDPMALQTGYSQRLQRIQAMPEGPAKQQALQILQGWAKDNLVK